MTLTAILEAAAVAERPKIGFMSFGCLKNGVNSEVMGTLKHNGAELTR